MRIALALLFSLVLIIGASCGGNESGTTLDEDTKIMLKTALVIASGHEINDIKTDRNGLSISYNQTTDDSQALLLRRALNLAMVTLSFMDKPQTVTIISMVDGKVTSKVVIDAGDLAALLIGDRSLEETLSRIKIQEK